MTFIIEKVSDMVFITGIEEVVFDAWDLEDFTERKLRNAMKRLQSNYQEEVTFIKKF